MKYLFIGGSKDGERLACNGDIIDFPVQIQPPYENSTEEGYFKKERYRKETYLCEGKPFKVFILEGIGNSTAFNRLLNGYRKPKE